MKRKLFKNYTYSFDKNESKLLSSFCKQSIKQMQTDERFFKDIQAFQTILQKLNNGEDEIKLTKDEKTRLLHQLTENRNYLEKKMKSSWFISRWFIKSMYNQYNNLIDNHFSE